MFPRSLTEQGNQKIWPKLIQWIAGTQQLAKHSGFIMDNTLCGVAIPFWAATLSRYTVPHSFPGELPPLCSHRVSEKMIFQLHIKMYFYFSPKQNQKPTIRTVTDHQKTSKE